MGSANSQGLKHAIAIDNYLKIEAKTEARAIKMLLLGPAECGKSTLLKQMRILHTKGFTDDEINHQKGVIYDNILTGILAISRALPVLELRFQDPGREDDVKSLQTFTSQIRDLSRMPPTMAESIQRIWADAGVQAAYERRNEFHLQDSLHYFLDEFNRVSDPNFRPNKQDLLRSRVSTTGIVQVDFVMKEREFRVFDVGGQRSERKKWIHCFDNVKAIIFIVALSEYDQKLWEDEKTNRMHESLALFDSIVNSRYFVSTSFMLFLNKKDIFEEKLRTKPITIAFPDYKGTQTYRECVDYIQDFFLAQCTSHDEANRPIYVHETCNTDTNQVQIAIGNVFDVLLNKSLAGAALL